MKFWNYKLILFLAILFFGFLLFTSNVLAVNLLTNPGHETGDNTGWTGSVYVRSAVESCPDYEGGGSNHQCVRPAGPFSFYIVQVYEGSYSLYFSYTYSSSQQTINLTSTYTTDYLDTAPDVVITDHVFGANYVDSAADTYRLQVILKNGSGGTITSYDTGNLLATDSWQTLSHTFSGYGSGLRSIQYIRYGQSAGFVAGAHGSAFDSASVEVGTYYTLTYATSTGGNISGTSTQSVLSGEDGTEVKAVPDTGYDFVQWSDGSTSTSRTDTNITTNTVYTASFTTSTYTLTYSAGTGGSITGDNSQTVEYNSSGSAVTAVADDGYTFSQWSDDSTANPRIDINVISDVSVSASFTANPVSTNGVSFVPPSTPKVVVPPSFNNDSVNSSVSNVYQMAVSDSPDFSSVSWELYNESYKTSDKTLYIKFRSKDGGVSEVYKITNDKFQIINNYEGKLIKYANLPKVYKIEDNKKRWIVDEQAFNYYQYDWANIVLVTEEFVDGENITKPINQNIYNFNRNLELGDTGEDVKELQKYLNSQGFILSPAGFPGSPGNETTMFGNATNNALIKFQQSVGLPAYGYFGPMTRSIVN